MIGGSRRRSWRTTIEDFFGVNDDWERRAPSAAQRRQDRWIAVAFFVVTGFGLELMRSVGAFTRVDAPSWEQYLGIALACVPLAWRRSRPIVVMLVLELHMFVTGIWLISVMGLFWMQILYFFALTTAVAWARDRQALMYAVGAVLTLMFGWLAWGYAFGTAADDIYVGRLPEAQIGLFGPMTASVLNGFLVNIVYFGGALLWGRSLWRAAKRMSVIVEQAHTIEDQSRELRDQAVIAERLRIARELHDVVAHHVSVMGVQAAAARRVLTRDTEAAAQALVAVEGASRDAVTEMRALLGTLRGTPMGQRVGANAQGAAAGSGVARMPGPGAGAGAALGVALDDASARTPEPGLAQIPALVTSYVQPGFEATYELVEDRAEASGSVPAPLALSTYRIVQEALANVRKHSTAGRAGVVVRVVSDCPAQHRYVEAEIVDNGSPVGGTSGTGLGLLGMRERVTNHGGTLDAGPRVLGGYRVRVRFPLIRPVAAGEPGAGRAATTIGAGLPV